MERKSKKKTKKKPRIRLAMVLLMASVIVGHIAFNHVYAWAGVIIPLAGVSYFIYSLINYLIQIK